MGSRSGDPQHTQDFFPNYRSQYNELAAQTRWLFHPDPLIDTRRLQGLFADHGIQPEKYLPQIQVWVVRTNQPLTSQALDSLRLDPRVDWIEPDGLLHASAIVPNDPLFIPQQPNLAVIGMPQAWSYTTGAPTWPIAVLDTGIDLDHPDLQSKIWVNSAEAPGNGVDDDANGFVDDVVGWNFVADNAIPQDDYSHGSHVSGIAAAATNNGVGVAGIAWLAPVMPLKVLNSAGDGLASDVAQGILYAADNQARIINLSLGDDEEFQVITAAVIYARSHGCLVVAAAGNSGGPVEYPAAQPEALAVAATNNNDVPWSNSNRGPEVDLAAPGVEIFSADSTGFYYSSSGTSMSAAHVSGVAALVWSLHPEWSVDQVTQVLTATALDIWAPGRDNLTGWGRIDASAAVYYSYLKFAYFPLVALDREAK